MWKASCEIGRLGGELWLMLLNAWRVANTSMVYPLKLTWGEGTERGKGCSFPIQSCPIWWMPHVTLSGVRVVTAEGEKNEAYKGVTLTVSLSSIFCSISVQFPAFWLPQGRITGMFLSPPRPRPPHAPPPSACPTVPSSVLSTDPHSSRGSSRRTERIL